MVFVYGRFRFVPPPNYSPRQNQPARRGTNPRFEQSVKDWECGIAGFGSVAESRERVDRKVKRFLADIGAKRLNFKSPSVGEYLGKMGSGHGHHQLNGGWQWW